MLKVARDHIADDELAEAFPNAEIMHVLSVTSQDQLSVAVTTLEAVRAFGGRLEAFSLARLEGRLDHRLKIVGLRPHEARVLSNRLAALPGVERASVEHHLLTR